MTEALPPSYWDDVNRYCGELLAGVRREKVGIFIMSATTQTASWQGLHEGTTSNLVRGVNRFIGIPQTYHVFRLFTPQAESSTRTVYRILFNPARQIIESATSLPEKEAPGPLPERHSFKDAWEQAGRALGFMNDRSHEQKQLESVGLHRPGPEDYTLLLGELQNGAGQK